jgi:outer membrane protein OmpA-like peptidoglycan-associated protein
MRELPGGGYEITILKDDLARDPDEVLRSLPEGLRDSLPGAASGAISVAPAPYVSTDREMVERRVAEFLEVPEGVTYVFYNDTGTLAFNGKASRGWIERDAPKALAIAGVYRIDVSGVEDPDYRRARSIQRRINRTVIHFPSDSHLPDPESEAEFTRVIGDLRDLEILANRMNVGVTLTLYGHADSTGSDEHNYDLSLRRTKTVAARLYAVGSRMTVVSYNMGSEFSERPGSGGVDGAAPAPALPRAGSRESRKLEFRVRLGDEEADPDAAGADQEAEARAEAMESSVGEDGETSAGGAGGAGGAGEAGDGGAATGGGEDGAAAPEGGAVGPGGSPAGAGASQPPTGS